jgi:hypothetical protein
MAVIDLKMAVQIDMEQLDKLQEKMKKTDEIFLKKIEKATTILPKGAEKVNHAWLQMVSKVGVYVDKLVENIKKGFDQICSKMDEMKEILSGIRQDLGGLEESISFGTLIESTITAIGAILTIGSAFVTLKGSAAAALASIGSALGSLLLLLGEGALIVGTFLAAFKLTDWILEITGARKYIDDFMFWIVDNFLSIKDEIVDAINYLVDYPEERLNVFKQFMVNALDSIVGGIKTAFNKIWEFLLSKPQWSIDLVESIKGFFVDTWESISKSFTEGLSSAWGAVEAFFNKSIAWIKSVFDISDFIKGVGSQIINKLKEGASEAWDKTKKFFENKVNWVKELWQFRKSPPFSIIYGYGTGFMEAFCQGIIDKTPLLESTLDSVAAKAEASLQIPVEAFASGSLTSGLGISADISATLDPIKDQFNDVYDHFGKVEQDAHDKSLTGWKDWGSSLTSFLDQLFKTNITAAYQTLKSGFSDLFSIFKGGGAASQGGLLGGLLDGASAEDGGLAAGGEASLSKGGGMLSKIGAALGPIGQIASVVMQIPQIVKQVWASIKDFAKSIASLFGGIGRDIKGLIKYVCYRNYTNFLYKRCCFSFAML